MVPIDPKMLPNKKKQISFLFFYSYFPGCSVTDCNDFVAAAAQHQDPSESDNSVIPSP